MEGRIPWAFTMDYETKEIVMTTYATGEKLELRAAEKDIQSMQNWFEMARHMEKEKQ